ncbi:MAG: TerC family protein [Fimbriimonadaceae bacterium]
MTLLTSGGAWIALVTLTILQIVLGVDNIVLLTLLTSALPKSQRRQAQKLGVLVATVSRLILLAAIVLLARVDHPFARIGTYDVSVKALLLAAGGLFLIWKATQEMYQDIEHTGSHVAHRPRAAKMATVLTQVFVLDVVFSIDQVMTAVGMTPEPVIQVASVLLSVVVMLLFVKPLSRFLEHHPSVRMLALSFLVMVGVALVAQATGYEFPKGYIYFGMVYAVAVEWLNIRRRANVARREADAGGAHPVP